MFFLLFHRAVLPMCSELAGLAVGQDLQGWCSAEVGATLEEEEVGG